MKYALAALGRCRRSQPRPCVDKLAVNGLIGGKCSLLQIECVCTDSNFIGDVACCVLETCDDDGQRQTIDYAKKIRGKFGDVPESAQEVCKSGGGGDSSSAAPSATESSSGSGSGSSSTPAASGSETPSSTAGAAATSSSPGAAPTMGAGVVGSAIAMAFAL
ncbi:hypothetical protein K4F52_005935 [Lecanicillium sp. MT-2017a]|nr:hypothetical protein K4F52_005935 [Lecanicillium sp. MT-2017a]